MNIGASVGPASARQPDLLFRKLVRWLILPIALLTFVNAIDRVNISFAASAMQRDIGLSPSAFGFGVSMFFVAYLLFQYPHALLLRYIGIRLWMLLSVSLWGLSGLLMAHVQEPLHFYAARFLLGVAEAGLAPGMTYFISQWVPRRSLAKAMAIVLAAVPVSLVLGGPICGWLLGMANPLGLSEWRWMFLISAIPNFVIAVAAYFYFVDRPDHARWLNDAERTQLREALAEGKEEQAPQMHWLEALGNLCVWRGALTWLLVMTGAYALVYWLPQLVRQFDLGHSEFAIGAISALPQAGLVTGLLLNSWHSDRTGERFWHVGLAGILAGAALIAAVMLPTGWTVMALLVVAGLAIGAAQGVFWTVPAAYGIGGGRVPVGVIAFISMFGTAGGIIGPTIIGTILERTGSFSAAIAPLAAMLILSAVTVVPFRHAKTMAAAPSLRREDA
jgi:MFS transporter, ACS family, tartrate transporter